jgi:hypothetical protein
MHPRKPAKRAAPARSRAYGICVELPVEQEVSAFASDAFEHRTFVTRDRN